MQSEKLMEIIPASCGLVFLHVDLACLLFKSIFLKSPPEETFANFHPFLAVLELLAALEASL